MLDTLVKFDVLTRLQSAVNAVNLTIKINDIPHASVNPISFDIEHDERGNLVCCGFYCRDNRTAYIIFDLRLLRLFDFRSVSLIAHNGVSDLSVLEYNGFNVPQLPMFDTQLLYHINDSSEGSYGLKDLAKRHLWFEYPDYDDIVGKHKGKTKKSPACPKISNECCGRTTLDKQPQEIVALYNALDCYVTSELFHKLPSNLSSSDYYADFELPLSGVLDKMESRGVRINVPYLTRLKNEFEAAQSPILAEIYNELGVINLNSPKQLLEALHAKGIKPILKGKDSTDKRALDPWNHLPVVQSLLLYGQIETLLSSFCNAYIQRQTTVVHPFFNQTGTRTGRLSCSNPNLLQIPRKTENGKRVRQMFIPREGFKFGDCDYGQIEPRVLAHLSHDSTMCSMFNSGVDFHDFTSKALSIGRDKAKVLNLSVGYRATFKSVSAQLKCSEKEAQVEIDKWWNQFPGLRRWQDKLIWVSKRSGYFTTLCGRRIKVDNLNSANKWQREAAERQLINNIAQASAREIMAHAMLLIDADKRLSSSFGLLVQVYDELLFESAFMEHDYPLVVDDMVNAVKLDVPLVVDGKTGLNWAEAH